MTSLLSFGKSAVPPVRERKSIQQMWSEYNAGDKKPLSDLVRAWAGIQALDPEDFNSFFTIAGYHGSPFRGAGWGNPQWWGGYCNHGNVLFPTWHRAYLLRLENALQSIKGCENVSLPYWNELDPESLHNGLPEIFTNKKFQLDTGKLIDNPLYSYKYQSPIWDNLSFPPINSSNGDNITTANPNYYRNPGDYTRRFPWSTLTYESDEKLAAEIKAYNDNLTQQENKDPKVLVNALNTNVSAWLWNDNAHKQDDPEHKATADTSGKYLRCLDAPNYTVFSNTTSAMEWNERKLNVKKWGPDEVDRQTSPEAVVPLESPHNDMHLAIGGFSYPGLGDANTNIVTPGPDPKELYPWANGDMGENETAAFDPIFYFHHCFIDKTFWNWQQRHNSTKKLEIIEGYPGTNSVDNQGPTPGVPGGSWLTLQSPLTPFKKGDKDGAPMATSEDVVDIEGQLGYTYVEPPLRTTPKLPGKDLAAPVQHHAIVSGINRGQLSGSFIIAAHKVDSKNKTRTLLGYEAVLNRWQTAGCSNCQTHLNVRAHIPLKALTPSDVKDKNVRVEGSIIGRRTTGKDDQVRKHLGTEKDGWTITVVDTQHGKVVKN